MNRNSFLRILLPIFSTVFCSCAEKKDKPSLDLGLATPLDIISVNDTKGEYFYVLNTDFQHQYSSGSLLVLDKDGNKIKALSIPRLGESLSATDSRLLIGFNRESDEEDSQVHLYNIQDPENPSFVKSFTLTDECTPAGMTSRSGYAYFAVSCENGHLYMGEFKDGDTFLSDSTLKKVREYPEVANAVPGTLYIDPKRDLLFRFQKDKTGGLLTDSASEDKETWENGKRTSESPDEIPDFLQQRGRDVLDETTRWNFTLYDIAKGKSEDFKFQDFTDIKAEEVRFLYFHLDNYDKFPDVPSYAGDQNIKYYRTNIRKVEADPEDPDSFYLLHAGLVKKNFSEHANNIVKVTFKTPSARVDSNGLAPTLNKYLEFKRVFGFQGISSAKNEYFSSFAVKRFSGRKTLFVNSFKDISNFDDPLYILGAANIFDGPADYLEWFTKVEGTANRDSYSGLALSNSGNLATISFFDQKVRIFEVKYGEPMSLLKTVE